MGMGILVSKCTHTKKKRGKKTSDAILSPTSIGNDIGCKGLSACSKLWHAYSVILVAKKKKDD